VGLPISISVTLSSWGSAWLKTDDPTFAQGC